MPILSIRSAQDPLMASHHALHNGLQGHARSGPLIFYNSLHRFHGTHTGLLHKLTRHTSISEPLHLLFSLPQMLFPRSQVSCSYYLMLCSSAIFSVRPSSTILFRIATFLMYTFLATWIFLHISSYHLICYISST